MHVAIHQMLVIEEVTALIRKPVTPGVKHTPTFVRSVFPPVEPDIGELRRSAGEEVWLWLLVLSAGAQLATMRRVKSGAKKIPPVIIATPQEDAEQDIDV